MRSVSLKWKSKIIHPSTVIYLKKDMDKNMDISPKIENIVLLILWISHD
jgi:hypothetical protein